MDYQQVQDQQKAKAVEQAGASVPLASTAMSETPSPVSAGGTGSFMADLTAALDAYASGSSALKAIDAELSGMKEIEVPELKERKGLSKFFYNLFHGKQAKKEAAAVEEAEQKKAAQEQRRTELGDQKEAANKSMGDALAQFKTLMGAATKSNIKEMINNEPVVRRIMATMPEANVKSTLDLLYPEMDEAHMDLFLDMITARFGVPIVDSSKDRINKLPDDVKAYVLHTIQVQKADGTIEKKQAQPLNWTLAALKKIYAAYLTIPADHLKLVKCLIHYSDAEDGGAAWGNAGVYYANYFKDREERKEGDGGGTCCSDSKDMRNGMNKMTLTVIHELGHVVDGRNNNYGYSKSADFRKWSKWVEVANDAEAVVNYMIDSMNGKPFKGELSDDALKLAKTIGQEMVKNQSSLLNSWSKSQALINTKVRAAEKLTDAEKDVLSAKFCDSTIESNLLYHIWMGFGGHTSASYLGCYNFTNVMKGMKRPFYQGYNNDAWFSFDQSKWSNKISAYQYRCPKEEFAETYASYHVAPTATHVVDGKEVAYKKGEKTPSGLKTWFEEKKLHLMDPSKVEGSSPIKDEKMAS